MNPNYIKVKSQVGCSVEKSIGELIDWFFKTWRNFKLVNFYPYEFYDSSVLYKALIHKDQASLYGSHIKTIPL